MKTLDRFRRNVYSQNGEDGLLEELLGRLGVTEGTCVEFGAWDGKHLSNTYNLVRKGWRAAYIEGDVAKYDDLLATQKEHPDQITAICGYVKADGADTLDHLLARAGVGPDIDLLSIDIDSYDWQVWESTSEISPLVVVIEINSSIRPGIRQIHQGSDVPGSSFTSTLELGRSKGYTLVAHTGNMVFVRSDAVHRVGLSPSEIEFPECLFDYSWVPRDAPPRHLLGRFRHPFRNA